MPIYAVDPPVSTSLEEKTPLSPQSKTEVTEVPGKTLLRKTSFASNTLGRMMSGTVVPSYRPT